MILKSSTDLRSRLKKGDISTFCNSLDLCDLFQEVFNIDDKVNFRDSAVTALVLAIRPKDASVPPSSDDDDSGDSMQDHEITSAHVAALKKRA